jgi:replicative DNA helicase
MSGGLVPPSDLDAEAVALAVCLLYPEEIDKVSSIVKPSDFYADSNGRIFEAILELEKQNKRADIVSVAGYLRDRGTLLKVGGTPYLAQLVDATPATARVEEHAKTIAEKAALRNLIKVCSSIATESYGDVGNFSEWLLASESKVYEATRQANSVESVVTIGDAVRTEIVNMTERKNSTDTVPGITTGFYSLDRKIGGWRKGAKYTIAARPGIGKSSFMLDCCVSAAEAGHGVVIVSIEMPREQLVQRVLSQLSGVKGEDMDRPQTLTAAQWKDIAAAAERIGVLPIVIVDSGTQNPSKLRGAVREGRRLLKRKCGDNVEVDLVAIDYIQIMHGEQGGTRENEVSQISGANRALAKQENCAVLELSQLNRKVEERPDKRPIMADLRESGAIEQDSFGILMLYRDDYYKGPEAIPDNKAEILIRKIRQYGSCGVVHVEFDAARTHFLEVPGIAQEFDDMPVDNGYIGGF